jgi:hypothetical protein
MDREHLARGILGVIALTVGGLFPVTAPIAIPFGGLCLLATNPKKLRRPSGAVKTATSEVDTKVEKLP